MTKKSRPTGQRPGKSRARKDRVRKCLVTGDTYPVGQLIRFVLDPDGNVIPDVSAKLPGRGGWVLAEREVLERAMKKKIFVRFGHRVLGSTGRKLTDLETLDAPEKEQAEKIGSAAQHKMRVTVDDRLLDLVEQLLRQRCLNYLGLVNRAGLLVSGFEKVRAALKAGKCRTLITAEDGADNGRNKICSGLGNLLEYLRVIDMFTREQLGQALGLPNAVHVALMPGGMTESFLQEFSRYESIAMR